jgi:hypothetical protein
MRRGLLIAGLAVIATASCLLAGRPGLVRTSGGESYEGEVTERPEEVVIRAHGVDTVVTRDRVASIEYASYEDRFRTALAALAADDIAGRIQLAREAFDRRDYTLALEATRSALDVQPMSREARQLESLISTQVQLEARRMADAATVTTNPADDVAENPSPSSPRRHRGLNDEQANRVRQLELSADDTVRVQFRESVRKRYVDSQPGMSYRAFAARSDVAQALEILNRGTPEMQDDVIIRGEPLAVQMFGRRIQTALVQGCATSNCHGGGHAGSFRLLTGTPDASTMITNFYLVTQYTQKIEGGDAGNMFSPTNLPLVDRGNATNSLLYQYALPRARAKHKHPAMRGWDGLFRNDDDRLARDLVQWMNVDLGRLTPDYGFTFTLGGSTDAASTGPATEPSSEPTTMPDEPSNP